MHDIGHDRDHIARLAGPLQDFTPPFLGNRKIAHFDVSSRFGLGRWLIGGAVLCIAASCGVCSRAEGACKLRGSNNDRSSSSRQVAFRLRYMKATRIHFYFSGVLLLLAVFVIGIYIVPKLQAGSPATARQSDAYRVSPFGCFPGCDLRHARIRQTRQTRAVSRSNKGRAQPFLIGINTHVGTIADSILRGKVDWSKTAMATGFPRSARRSL